MKKGFTMIELVFVIVIIGILSAIALPKFIETANTAHDNAIKSFVATLNRTTKPVFWSKSISEGNNGLVISYCDQISNALETINELTYTGNCAYSANTAGGGRLNVEFTDGNTHLIPAWNWVAN